MSATAGRIVTGIPVSSGEASGPIYVVPPQTVLSTSTLGSVPGRLQSAMTAAAERLEALAADAPAASAEILRAQAMMATDPALESAINRELGSGRGMREAVLAAAEEYAQQLESLSDEYLRQRASDVREVAGMLLAELSGDVRSRLRDLRRPAIVIGHEMSPADTLSVDPSLVLGIVTEAGGRTSHAAIVARELGIPAIVGAEGAVDLARREKWGHLDGDRGELTFLSTEPALQHPSTKKRLDVARAPVRLMANVSSAPAARSAAAMGAAGIGLFRTEMLFLGRDEPMSEKEQVAVYGTACDAMAPHAVVVRCLDIGSDKSVAYVPPSVHEPNPALGRRGLRLWLACGELREPQVRALVRVASDHPNLQVMFPMVGAPEEMALARASFEAAAREIGGRVPKLGMMVELPAAAVAVAAFKGLAEFISLGTNDLTQYALGIDRELEWDPYLGEFSPGVLRIIQLAISGAREVGMESAVCGELAGLPEGAVFLTGVGVDSLSMAPTAMPGVLEVLANLGADRCRVAAKEALKAPDAAAARAALSSAVEAAGRKQ